MCNKRGCAVLGALAVLVILGLSGVLVWKFLFDEDSASEQTTTRPGAWDGNHGVNGGITTIKSTVPPSTAVVSKSTQSTATTKNSDASETCYMVNYAGFGTVIASFARGSSRTCIPCEYNEEYEVYILNIDNEESTDGTLQTIQVTIRTHYNVVKRVDKIKLVLSSRYTVHWEINLNQNVMDLILLTGTGNSTTSYADARYRDYISVENSPEELIEFTRKEFYLLTSYSTVAASNSFTIKVKTSGCSVLQRDCYLHQSEDSNTWQCSPCATSGKTEVHAIQMYQPQGTNRPGNSQPINVVTVPVTVTSPKNVVLNLVFNTYEATDWKISTPAHVTINEVTVLSFYHTNSSATVNGQRPNKIVTGFVKSGHNFEMPPFFRYIEEEYGFLTSFQFTYAASEIEIKAGICN